MNKVNTQADKLKSQFKPVKNSLTRESLLDSLKNSKLHGKKVDVPLQWIKTADNIREEIKDIDSLVLQIRETGLMQPIGIQALDNEITVVYGHRRLAAFLVLQKEDQIKYKTIPCLVQVYENQNMGRVVAQSIENLGRSGLKPLEECRGILELKNILKNNDGTSYTNSKLGEFIGGVHRKTIDLAIVIAKWPAFIHEFVKENESIFTISVLRKVAKKKLSDELLKDELTKEISGNRVKKDGVNSKLSILDESFKSRIESICKYNKLSKKSATRYLNISEQFFILTESNQKAGTQFLSVLSEYYQKNK